MRKSIGLLAFLAIWGVQVCFAQTYETSGTGRTLTTVSTANPEPGHGAATGSMQLQQAPAQQTTITGTVTDTEGEPLAGVTVRLKSQPGLGVSTNVYGEFNINVSSMNETLIFSFIGMENRELTLQPNVTNYKVTMAYSETALESVVVQAGILQRDKLGFTGSFKTVTGEELKSTGSINVLQSLRSLDPSLAFAENNLMGSDPNTMAHITLRGGSTMNITSTFDDMSVNPNQPLFILDGFPTTLQVVNDMDINRIESITILKDASSTAIFGSQGGNGVIVVETIKPKAGEVRIAYSGNFNLSLADLSVYDLMNAEEKLEFERRANYYGNINDWETNTANIANYYGKLERIRQGIDTYWLKVPIRTGFTQSHSLTIDGGEGSFLYQFGVNYNNTQGVMKESGRETFGGNVQLHYRKDKLNIRNNTTVSVTNASDGSWTTGTNFQNFVQASPYYKMQEDDGTISKFLGEETARMWGDTTRREHAMNPYYNAVKAGDSQNNSRSFSLVNNTNIDYMLLPNLRWVTSLQLATTRGSNLYFLDPAHTSFDGLDYTLQGEYRSGVSNSWNYNLNTRFTYTYSLQELHNFTLNGRAEISSNQVDGTGYTVTGFPEGVGPIPTYAYGFKENSKPSYAESTNRMASFVAAFSYNYNNRYLFDFNYNYDGSTAFGRNKKFQSFWSVGAGWNVDREAFAENWEWMNALKLRATYGKNGNQNITNLATNVYGYFSGADIFGTAAYLSQLANPDLKWQVVTTTDAGLDLTLLDNRLNVTFDVFWKKTDPLAVSLDQKPSSGVSGYSLNLGHLKVKGWEVSASYNIIRDIERDMRLNVRLTASSQKSTYGGFAESLAQLNEAYKKETGVDPKLNVNSLVHYRDGYSPSDMWAVRSLGIDPATGVEMYLDRFDNPTETYSADDRVKIASQEPDLQGIVGLTFQYKDFTANFNFRYSFGSYALNTALFEKVENVDSYSVLYNQDRRALYDRWQSAGDIAQFKSIRLITQANQQTPLSSRFIQRNNYFAGENAKLSWNMRRAEWIRTLGLEYLTISASYQDLFYLSSMKRERGIGYPFARSVIFGLSAQF